MTELEILEKENKELKRLLGLENEEKPKAFSSISIKYLKNLNIIEQNFDNKDIFNSWFDNTIKISNEVETFLDGLIDNYGQVLNKFNETTLTVKFIGIILDKISFFNKKLKISDFYHSPLSYKNQKIDFNGFCDFYVAKGLGYPENPYFFIQEYKPSQGGGDPEPQLVAEMICAIELNNWKQIKGCFIVGINWNFVILEKLEKDKYQYFVSKNFDSTDIEKLKDIYRNLLFVKNEIIEMVKNG